MKQKVFFVLTAEKVTILKVPVANRTCNPTRIAVYGICMEDFKELNRTSLLIHAATITRNYRPTMNFKYKE